MLRLLVICAAFAHAASQNYRIPSVKVDNKGLYRVEPGPTYRFMSETSTISTKLGTAFGFRFSFKSPVDGQAQLRLVSYYPKPLKDPATGKVSDQFAMEQTVNLVRDGDANGFFVYELSEPWELVPGRWRLEVWQGKRRLVSESFTLK